MTDKQCSSCGGFCGKVCKRSQELFGKTEQLEAEIKRLQELADYRLKLLTKMPSEWVGLTDEELNEHARWADEHGGTFYIAYARSIEAKLKEQQMILNQQGCAECGKGSGYALYCGACHDEFRVWVGLTDEDIEELRCHGAHSVSDTDFRAIEAKLKEKQNEKQD